MSRSHLFRPVTDESGNVLAGAKVTMRQDDSYTPITQTIWDGPNPNANPILNPFTIPGGYIDVWLDQPERVNFFVEAAGHADISVYLDVHPPAAEVVRSSTPLEITNGPSAALVLTGTSSTQASWQPVPVPAAGAAPVHYHRGAGTNSVSLGTGSIASASQATAVGDVSQATATSATAYGQNAQATAINALAMGVNSLASATGAVATGYTAQASGSGAVAVGATSIASGSHAVAIGTGASATSDGSVSMGYLARSAASQAVALGDHAVADGPFSLAVGQAAAAHHVNSMALGNGTATTADNQIVLGVSGNTLLAAGELRVLGNAAFSGTGGTVGFFGSTGAVKQTVSGSRNGIGSLAALLTYLDGIGLIVDGSSP